MLKCRRRRLVVSPSVRCLLLLAVTATLFFRHIGNVLNEETSSKNHLRHSSRVTSRHLLSTVKWEQCDFEIGHTRNYSNPSSWTAPNSAFAWVALYVFLIIVVFVALAIICDDFFVPSLEAISEKLDLSEDVAGATFMAAGSSAPELFTSIAGVTVESDVGVGTIVGSAVFNLLGICALSATFAGQVLQLDWRPLSRDSAFYGLSICVFIWFAWDGEFEIYESAIILSLYVLYIIIMKFNPKLMEFMSRCGKKKVNPSLHERNSPVSQPETINENPSETGDDKNTENTRKFSHVNKGTFTKELTRIGSTERNGSTSNLPVIAEKAKNHCDAASMDDNDSGADTSVVVCPCLPPVQADIPSKHGSGCFSWLRFILSWLLFVISFPFVILFTWTIPNCSTPETKKYYLFSFFMSIAWIAALSFAMVTLVGRAGCILGVDKFTMGLVVVAIGTSIPDALSSVLVARDGYGDMAVSNAIGSNVFDIDLGIGLPFLISSLIRGSKPVKLINAKQQKLLDDGEMAITPHVKFGIILLIILFLSLLVFACNKFRLTKKLGISFVMLYIVFVSYAYVQDLYCDNSC